ncbi:MAG: hypothetical protein FRX49_02909 [Trebouxia sp. A1-2]|nr:MAG: hypothetical protein FRX49_02909 [Trebouxia sp. A1-2]
MAQQLKSSMMLHLRDIQAFFTDAGGHQGVEGTRPEVSQHLLLLGLLHANPIYLSRGLPDEDPAKGKHSTSKQVLGRYLAVMRGSCARSISTMDCTLSLRFVKMITRPGSSVTAFSPLSSSAAALAASAVLEADSGVPSGLKCSRTTSRSAAILGADIRILVTSLNMVFSPSRRLMAFSALKLDIPSALHWTCSTIAEGQCAARSLRTILLTKCDNRTQDTLVIAGMLQDMRQSLMLQQSCCPIRLADQVNAEVLGICQNTYCHDGLLLRLVKRVRHRSMAAEWGTDWLLQASVVAVGAADDAFATKAPAAYHSGESLAQGLLQLREMLLHGRHQIVACQHEKGDAEQQGC